MIREIVDVIYSRLHLYNVRCDNAYTVCITLQHAAGSHLVVISKEFPEVYDICDALPLGAVAGIPSASGVCSRLAALRAMHHENVAGTLWLHSASNKHQQLQDGNVGTLSCWATIKVCTSYTPSGVLLTSNNASRQQKMMKAGVMPV